MLQEKRVVTCFLESDGEILILQRSELVSSYQGRWAAVSGYVEESADEQALTEMAEETGLSQADFKLTKKGKPLIIKDEMRSSMLSGSFIRIYSILKTVIGLRPIGSIKRQYG